MRNRIRRPRRLSSRLRGASLRGTVWRLALVGGLTAAVGAGAFHRADVPRVDTPLVVLGANDLGMHCMQQDFSEFLILPPFNTLHAQVIDRSGEHPELVTEGVTVEYTIPQNTRSTDKTNWWTYDQDLLGVDSPPDVGLEGAGMSGTMTRNPGKHDWKVVGIPITPIDDDGREDPYPLATVSVRRQGQVVAQTQIVVPVSWEINCNLCHNTPGISPGLDILQDHDRLHGTTLVNSQPVFCASCHADPALGAEGDPDVSTFSSAMHGAHSTRMDMVSLDNTCYACHPGIRTQCQRDVHFASNITCIDCHGDMAAVGDPGRTPWVDEPRCDDCHSRSRYEFEQPGTLYRDSVGHGGVSCYACHGSPHAITPTVTAADNLQALRLQGHTGVINDCTVCHSRPEGDPFFHRTDD
ncbi:MAG: cytochrome c3 family protein [Phycisphaerales bacterium JB041]